MHAGPDIYAFLFAWGRVQSVIKQLNYSTDLTDHIG
uniref:Uncharacterized protein n=1 Tax=Anguilla anguilla TaxID=7936 RepID=A0A0E9PYQ8_ANGAN